MDEKIIHKIKKLLNKANGKANENESQSTMLMAQKLMAEHNISMRDVNDVDDQHVKELDDRIVVPPKGRIMWWEKSLSTIIASNFRCFSYTSKRRNFDGKVISKVVFLGLKEDTEIAAEVYAFAVNAMKRLAKEYILKVNAKGNVATALRNDFNQGFLVGLDNAFEEQIKKNSWGLVLVTDKLVVQEKESRKMSKAKPQTGIQPLRLGNDDALREGYIKGKEFADDTKSKKIEE